MELQLNILDHFSQCHAVYQQTSRMLNFIILQSFKKIHCKLIKIWDSKTSFKKKGTCVPEGENYLAIFHAFICVLWHLWVYYKFKTSSYASLHDTSVGRALHQNWFSHGSESCDFHNCLSCVYMCYCNDHWFMPLHPSNLPSKIFNIYSVVKNSLQIDFVM